MASDGAGIILRHYSTAVLRLTGETAEPEALPEAGSES
jgi:hypothetical protein